MTPSIKTSSLFQASCLALLVTSLSFGIRAGILNRLGTEFHLDAGQLGTIAATAFWGFPLAVVIGGMVVDVIGMKRLLLIAAAFHLLGIVLTIFASGYWTLFLSTLLVGIANGTVEAACNPLVATIYKDNKTTKLNHFHLWFPGGIFIGTLLVYFTDKIEMSWQLQVASMLIPTVIYGYLFSRLDFPVTERVASGVSTNDMYKEVFRPLFIFMILCMFGTAITELFTGQWIDVLLHSVTENSLLILTLTTGVMVIGRGFAEPVVHRFSPQGVLLISAVLASVGLYILGHSSGNTIFVGALVFGMGVCYFWPTMIGFVSENLPKTGAVGLNFMGGAGMFAVSLYLIFMGDYYKGLLADKTPAEAGPEIINVTNFIPLALILAFGGLYFYMKGKPKVTI